VHDASGLLPARRHRRAPTDWEFGPRTPSTPSKPDSAAAFGGTTTLIDFCNQTAGRVLVGLKPAQTPRQRLRGSYMIMLDVNEQSR
jgi:hypothetical protein